RAQVTGASIAELLEGERDDEAVLLHRPAEREVDGALVAALLAHQADQRTVSGLVVVLALEADALRLAVLDDLHARQRVVNKLAAASLKTSGPGLRFRRRLLRKRNDWILLRRAPGRATDQLLAVSVRPHEPDAPVRHQGVELKLAVDDHVEGDVDDVAIVAAQVEEPALQVASDEGQSLAAGAAERAHQGAGEDRAEIDGEHAQAEQEPVQDLAGVLRKKVGHGGFPAAVKTIAAAATSALLRRRQVQRTPAAGASRGSRRRKMMALTDPSRD